jgi:putative hydrolase of the HAD superfamily
MPSPPSAVCIDLDGTVSDTDSSLHAGILGGAIEAQRLTGIPVDQWMVANEQAAAEIWSAISTQWITGGVSSTDPSTRIYERTLELVGKPAELAGELVLAHGVAARAALRPYEDVAPFLSAVSAFGAKIALITNGASETQRDTLSTIGLDSAFDVVLVSAELGVRKPDVEIFRRALLELGSEPETTWHIGDSVESDVLGATAAGLQPVWLNRSNAPRPVDLVGEVTVVTTLLELIPLLES